MGIGIAAFVALIVAIAALAYAAHNAEPILRRRVVATLEDRFQSPVELDALHISVLRGLQVSGSGLRILDPNWPTAQPTLSVASFHFRTGVRQLLEPTMRVDEVWVQGMQLTIPPKAERGPLLTFRKSRFAGKQLSIKVDKIVVSNMTLTIDTDKPGKQPLVFPIRDITLHDVGPGRAFPFDAQLVNPMPVGDIHSAGHFGPWQRDNPRDTPVDGDYSFTNANLATIKGISGTLSSTGNYSGTLGEIAVTGTTLTPNFALDVSEHPVDLRTEFNATVDGTTGDTILNSIHATLLHTVLQIQGRVVRAGSSDDPSGHLIDLSVASDQARVEDILRLAARTSPPLVNGGLALRATLRIPPGHASVSQKMHVQGTFRVHGATFTNPHWQQTADNLSARAQGNPREKADSTPTPRVQSDMSGNFALAAAVASLPSLQYQMPGAQVQLAGKYSLDGQTFDFAGTVRTQATASQMLTGWKSIVAMPFDRLLKKDGAGVEVPVTISGTKSDPKFGVDLSKLTDQILSRHKQPAQPAPSQPAPAESPQHP
jgi:hypothetical protein